MTREMEYMSLLSSTCDGSSPWPKASEEEQLEPLSNTTEDEAVLLLHSCFTSPLHCWIHTR